VFQLADLSADGRLRTITRLRSLGEAHQADDLEKRVELVKIHTASPLRLPIELGERTGVARYRSTIVKYFTRTLAASDWRAFKQNREQTKTIWPRMKTGKCNPSLKSPGAGAAGVGGNWDRPVRGAAVRDRPGDGCAVFQLRTQQSANMQVPGLTVS
jgi:hypothetical protein